MMTDGFSEIARCGDRIYRVIDDILNDSFSRVRPERRPVTPSVDIVADMTPWGRCRFLGREIGGIIELKEDLIRFHPWFAVEDVLRHELAHYLKEWFYPCVDEPAHGRLFRQMCEKIGANPHASSDYPTLDEWLLQDDDSDDSASSPMAKKVQKLLSLSESPNEHEALLALTKARELMSKYSLTEEETEKNDSDPFISVEKELSGSRVSNQESWLGGILSEYYDVRCITSRKYYLEDDSTSEKSIIIFNGRRSKVKIALYVWDYISRFLENAWLEAFGNSPYRNSVRRKRDFQYGCLIGIREVMERQNKHPEIMALVRVDKELDKYFHARFPRTCRSTGGYRMNKNLKEAGRMAGLQLQIHPGMENKNDSQRKMLK
ncbi:MAG: DUF2786 domain-containing protein [Victivallales bacterium]|nr:DUF2786 domain-containing protein [Victivallales bacterium]